METYELECKMRAYTECFSAVPRLGARLQLQREHDGRLGTRIGTGTDIDIGMGAGKGRRRGDHQRALTATRGQVGAHTIRTRVRAAAAAVVAASFERIADRCNATRDSEKFTRSSRVGRIRIIRFELRGLVFGLDEELQSVGRISGRTGTARE